MKPTNLIKWGNLWRLRLRLSQFRQFRQFRPLVKTLLVLPMLSVFSMFSIASVVWMLGVTQAEGATLAEKLALADQLKREAVEAEREGFYDRSIELARQIQSLTGEIDELVAVARRWYTLKQRIATARQVRADLYAPEEYNLALEYYNLSYTQILEENVEEADLNIDEGLYYADLAIEKSKDLFIESQRSKIQQTEVIGEKPVVEIEVVKVEDEGDGVYVVQLIPSRRDCLWRIAEYEFVYNDPFKWPRIYEGNRDTISDPDLIYPGQRIVIPPLPVEPELTKPSQDS